MTPEERTQGLISGGLLFGLSDSSRGKIAAAIREAEAEMKERCAKVAEEEEKYRAERSGGAGESAARRIAQDIRALE